MASSVDRNAAQGCRRLCFPLPSVQCQSCRPWAREAASCGARPKGPKAAVLHDWSPKWTSSSRSWRRRHFALRTLRPPWLALCPLLAVFSPYVHLPLGAVCDQANKNQHVSPASQAPLWGQQTECHSNQQWCLLSLCCPGCHRGLEDALFWEKWSCPMEPLRG